MGTADTATVQLADGRRLAYSQYGASKGRPVLLFHGLPGSRLQRPPDIEEAAALNIRIIAIDRPGIGLSDPQPGRTLADWPRDVAVLAAALRLPRFSVLGVSGGAPYAAACGTQLSERLQAVGIVSGIGPLDGPDTAADLNLRHRLLLTVARRCPTVLALSARLGAWLTRGGRGAYLRLMGGAPPVPDRGILARSEVQTVLAADLAEAFRQGIAGTRREFEIATRPWGFAPSDIRVPVALWHGEDDTIVPIGVGRRLAASVPDCRAQYLPGEGHFFVLDRWREILEDLLRVAEARAGRASRRG
jgi:pimeloyl-ACP methyl ester carboxylesterase